VAAAGLAPVTVSEVEAKLKRWGNPYREIEPSAPETLAGTAAAVLFVGAAAQYLRPQTLVAARFLLEKLGVAYTLVGVGRSSAYLPYTLGLTDTARALAHSTVVEVNAAQCRRVIVLTPEDAHTFLHVYPLLGIEFPAEIEVVELVDLLAQAVDSGQLKLHQIDTRLTYHDPAHTARLPARALTVRKLLAALAEEPLSEMFWRGQRAAPGGSVGGLEFTQPALAAQMTRERLAEAQATGAQVLVTEDPAALAQFLAQADGSITVQGLYELLVEHLSHS
jgi:Fe-S oxidoreductase